MVTEPDTYNKQPIHREIKLLRRIADDIRMRLQASRPKTPDEIINGLSQLSSSLSQINKKVTKHEEERMKLVALADIGQVINSSLETSEVLRIVMDTIVRLTGAERGFLMLRDNEGNLSIRVARNWEQETLNASEFALSSTIVNRVSTEGVSVLTTNAQEDPRFDGQESIVAYNLRSILCVPLKMKGNVTGIIYADNRIRTGLFTETDRDLLTGFANQAAVAIENARLFESVRMTLDEVTELKNLMDNVFESIASGVITSDIADKITMCNRAAESILGQSSSLMIGHSLHEMLPSLSSALNPHITSVRQTDSPLVGLELSHHLPDRGPVDLRFNLSPLKDANQHTQGLAIVLDDLTVRRQLEAQRRLFEKMVSPAVIDQLDPDEAALGGKRAEITTLFADIRGFTSFSEKLEPEELVSILNLHLSASADAVLAQEGTIDKFMGDAILAWFNAPIPQPDHTLRAVHAALGIRAGIENLHSTLPPEAHLSFSVGIHFGEAVLGLVGTEKRVDYTAIGDSVNTAKRIQENSNPGQILISEEAYQLTADHIEVRSVQPVLGKGKSEPITVFEVMGLRS
jgi:PAS domain S-box-containing protein